MNIYFKSAIAALIFSAGWTANGYRLNAEIAEIHKNQSEKVASNAIETLDKFKDAAKIIGDAASGAKMENSNLFAKLNEIQKGMKNAKALPIDCKPDVIRLQSLTDAVRATNDATARSVPKK